MVLGSGRQLFFCPGSFGSFLSDLCILCGEEFLTAEIAKNVETIDPKLFAVGTRLLHSLAFRNRRGHNLVEKI